MSTLLDLTRMNQIPVGFTLDGMQALRNAQETDQVNLEELVRKQDYERQMDPLRIQQQSLANLSTGQKLAEGEYTLASAGRKDMAERELFGAKQNAELRKLLTAASDDEAKLFENELYKRLQATRPSTPQHTAATKALEATRTFQEEKRKHAHSIQIAGMNNATQLKLEQMRIDAGKYTKANRMGFEESIRKLKKASEIIAAYRREALIAQQGGDVETARHYLQIANDPRLMAQAEMELRQSPTGGRAGEPDIGAMGIPTVPQTSITPQPLPTPGGATTPATKPAGQPPSVGEVRRGYRFKGGDPSVKENWELVK